MRQAELPHGIPPGRRPAPHFPPALPLRPAGPPPLAPAPPRPPPPPPPPPRPPPRCALTSFGIAQTTVTASPVARTVDQCRVFIAAPLSSSPDQAGPAATRRRTESWSSPQEA